MARVGSFDGKSLAIILHEKGFVHKRTTGSHYLFCHLETGKTIPVPIHPGDLPRGTQQRIFKMAGIGRDDH